MTQKEQHTRDAADIAAGILTLGVWAELVPFILGVLGILWFLLRFVNFFRTNFLGKKSWLFK